MSDLSVIYASGLIFALAKWEYTICFDWNEI